MSATQCKILVGSTNPIKVAAAKAALSLIYPHYQIDCQGMKAPSGVSDQPMTAAETRLGALNRVRYCQQHQQADFYIAMEGGVDMFDDGPATFAYIVIGHGDQISVNRSASLPLPLQVYAALQQGQELGHVMDALFNTVNIKQAGGAIGLLTNGVADRQGNYTQAIVLAMAPILHPQRY
ncbi:inosine/xanthosine triphosphatase [Shewanella sp. NIFS-20-20]|uniref:inosine/xanthosine triphosphatase n=1 Tax=Shewanella sp. NIFS-20-20 TaxID=2853806 RepID=UPI001C45B69C|nr:inosine/xanthosine triphosphatase [Shewanella sp. NIFS-20-20]MBV7316987.1 inosine/xanthosine triphosphatase [Shewanella sp. NIFS-20-20]